MEVVVLETLCNVPIPQTSQELEQAVRQYKSSEVSGNELFCQWQAIRTAALMLKSGEPVGDRIPGEDSY
jgi:hypothetical protein